MAREQPATVLGLALLVLTAACPSDHADGDDGSTDVACREGSERFCGEDTEGTGGELTCHEVEDDLECSAPDAAMCLCQGCVDDDKCDQDEDDCVCPDCLEDDVCNNPQACNSDGICEPFVESCHCPDCAGHPLC